MIWLNFGKRSQSDGRWKIGWLRFLWRRRWTPFVLMYLNCVLLMALPAYAQEDICPILVPEGETWEAMYSVMFDTPSTSNPCMRQTWWSGWMTLEPGTYDIGGDLDGLVFTFWLIRPYPRDDGEGAVNQQWYVICPGWDAYPGLGVCLFEDGFESGDTSQWSLEVPQ